MRVSKEVEDQINRLIAEAGGPASAKPRKASKYNNKKTVYKGVLYDSKAEADYARFLDDSMAYRPGMFWLPKPKFRLGCPENVYVADFIVYYGVATAPDRPIEVVDVKGVWTAKFKRDVKLWRSYGPCPLCIVKRSGSGWNTQVVTPGDEGCD